MPPSSSIRTDLRGSEATPNSERDVLVFAARRCRSARLAGLPVPVAIPRRGRLGRRPVLLEVLAERGLHLVEPVLADRVRLHRRLDLRDELVDVRLLLPRQPVGGLLQDLVVLVEARAVEFRRSSVISLLEVPVGDRHGPVVELDGELGVPHRRLPAGDRVGPRRPWRS